MAITTLNNRSINRSDTAASGQLWTATSATASDFQAAEAAGKVLQVLSAHTKDAFTASSTDFTDITDLTIDITPAATSSKILVLGHLCIASNTHAHARCVRDSTVIGAGTASGSRLAVSSYAINSNANTAEVHAFVYLDSPSSTSELTYKFQLEANYSSGTAYINRTYLDTDAIYVGRGSSTITVMEIGV